MDAADGRVDWRSILDGYQASVDWPSAYFWRELVATYPDAKVILSVRDPQRWYDSASATIFTRMHSRRSLRGLIGLAMLTLDNPRMRHFPALLDRIIRQGTFGGDLTDRVRAIEIFEEHNAQVKAQVPAERLLVYEVSQGWEPLCAFLGVGVPADPFPHLNEAKEFQDRSRRQAAATLAKLGAAAVAAAALLAALRRRRRLEH